MVGIALRFEDLNNTSSRIEARKIYKRLSESDIYFFYPEVKELVQKQIYKLEEKYQY